MTWEIIARLIVQYGIPGAYSIWQITQQHEAPTQAAWDELNKLALKSYDEYIAEAKAVINLKPPA